jgi:ribosomal protein S6--L-glutamate ligase
MRIGVIMRRQSAAHATPMTDAIARLRAGGATVELLHPNEQRIDLSHVRVAHDLYVLKEKSDLTLSFAAALHAAGATILNSFPVSLRLRDKVLACKILQAAGVPTPATYVASHVAQLVPLLADGPLVVKPYRGSRGVGVRVFSDAAELTAFSTPPEPIFAQRYHRSEGRDRKIYVIGGEIFGVKRVWPSRTAADKLGESFEVEPELAEIARRCGDAFGIDLYGVDIVISQGRPYVVDASSFPGFKGVPDGGARLARYLRAAAERAVGRASA